MVSRVPTIHVVHATSRAPGCRRASPRSGLWAVVAANSIRPRRPLPPRAHEPCGVYTYGDPKHPADWRSTGKHADMSIAEIFETLEYGPAPESASPATRWLDEHDRSTRLYIGGEWRDPATAEWFDTTNPA